MKSITWKYYVPLAGALLVILGSVSPAQAQLLLNTSASNPADFYDWSQLGSTFTDIGTPVSVTSNLGATATLNNGGDTLERRDEANGWSGNFANGAPVIWNQNDQQNITLTLDSPVQSIGAQIQSDSYGGFTAQIDVYGASNVLIESLTENGTSDGNNDDSAIFLGATDPNGADIYAISFSTPTSGAENDFALGDVLVNYAAVPEPLSFWYGTLCLLALGLVTLYRSYRKDEVSV